MNTRPLGPALPAELLKTNWRWTFLSLVSDVSLVAFVLAASSLGPATSALAYGFLALWALKSPFSAVQALTLAWLAGSLNPGLFGLAGVEALRWLVIFAAISQVVMTAIVCRPSRVPRPVAAVLLFGLVAAATAMVSSYAFDVSAFKLVTFVLGATAVLMLADSCSSQRERLERWLLTFFAAVTLGSFPLIFMDVGYYLNGSGFQGLFNHPQLYGTILALYLAWLTALCVGRPQGRAVNAFFALLAAVSLFATESRTGVLALVLALLTTALLSSVLSKRAETPRPRTGGRRVAKVVLGVGVLLTVLVTVPSVRGGLEDFFLKGGRGGERAVVSSMASSRGFLILRSWQNFVENPLFGIGFGLPSSRQDLEVTRDPFFRLPLGAPAEKGIVYLAVLEETGTVGAVAFGFLLFVLIRPILRRNDTEGIAIISCCLFINLGEAVLLSVGATGLVVWIMIGLARLPRNSIVPRAA